MRLGIKRKLLLVLVGVLLLTTSLDALLASYYTDRQNQASAFVALNRSLLAWHDDLQAMTRRLRGAALATVGDTVVLNQLTELVSLQFSTAEGGPRPANDAIAMARSLSYAKAVSLNRLYLALRTSGFSRIAVYTGGTLSHAVSSAEAGMMIQRGTGNPVWVTTRARADGNLELQNWPSWQEAPPAAGAALTVAAPARPTVDVAFPSPDLAAIDIIVPVQGVFEEYQSDFIPPKYRLVTRLAIADPARTGDDGVRSGKRHTAATLVFSRLIDRAALDAVAAKTGLSPVLLSPDGRHRQRLDEAAVTPDALLRQAQDLAPQEVAADRRRTVAASSGALYEALLPWQYEQRTRMILGLSSSRASTLSNIRQTVTAILLASGLILVLSFTVGIYWVGRFIDPIVALTNAVKQIGKKRRQPGPALDPGGAAPGRFQFIAVEAPDEIGELSSAFNVMTDELRRAFETLEQRVQSRTAELRQQTRYLRTLIDTLPLWVWLKDTERRYLTANQATAAACGHQVDEMVGKSDQQLWPPALAERYLADDQQVIDTRARTTVEQGIAGADGVVWMETYRAPVLDEDGTLLGMVGAARNISERKAAEAAREAALAEAVLLARQRSDFLAQMSHELRTPLNAIMGYAQLLRRDTHQTAERQESGLATIYASSQHLLTLINDILDLARVEAGKLVLHPVPVQLGSFLRVVADIMRVKAEEKSLFFSYEASADVPAAVTVDDKRLRQVLLNLLGNAVKFTDRGAVSLRLLPAPRGRDTPAPAERGGEGATRLRFEVADSGIGMSAEQIGRIFKPFEQVAEPQRREGGTGLGLAISQQLIHLMGSNIEVASQVGEGSLFWFELTLPVATVTLAVLPELRTIVGYEGEIRRLLIVDDVPQNRVMLMDILQALGFVVADARNGQECLALLDSFKPDLIVMDVMMPVMDGHEATRRIRQLPAWGQVPIISVSASATHDDELTCYAAGANAFLPKPIEHDSLLAAIGRALSLRWISAQAPPAELDPRQEDPVDLVIPPAAEIDALYHLVRLGNMQKIAERAAHLQALDPAYAPFAKRLHALAQGYQSKALAAFVARHRRGHEAPPVLDAPV
ncbi:MAG: response regulator [Massilia sp.]